MKSNIKSNLDSIQSCVVTPNHARTNWAKDEGRGSGAGWMCTEDKGSRKEHLAKTEQCAAPSPECTHSVLGQMTQS